MIPDPSAFALFALDDDLVVYDRRSGQTHVFNALAAEAFRALLAAPLTEGALCDVLTDMVDPERLDEVATALARVVVRFSDLGIIETADG